MVDHRLCPRIARDSVVEQAGLARPPSSGDKPAHRRLALPSVLGFRKHEASQLRCFPFPSVESPICHRSAPLLLSGQLSCPMESHLSQEQVKGEHMRRPTLPLIPCSSRQLAPLAILVARQGLQNAGPCGATGRSKAEAGFGGTPSRARRLQMRDDRPDSASSPNGRRNCTGKPLSDLQGADHAPASFRARARSSNFWILPVEVVGRSPNSTRLGHWKPARC